jgi:PAS domain-containing protein
MVADPARVAELSAGVDALARHLEQVRADLNGGGEALLAYLQPAYEELRVAEEEVRSQHEEITQLLDARRSERWLRERLMSLLPTAVVVTDAHGIVQTANAAASLLLQVRVDRLIGKPMFSFIDVSDRGLVRSALVKGLRDQSDFRVVATMHARSGPAHEVELAATWRQDSSMRDAEVTWVVLPVVTQPEGAVDWRDARLAQALVEMTRLPLGVVQHDDLLERMATFAQQALGPGVMVSVVMGDPERPELEATSPADAARVDRAQRAAGQGPSWECQATGEVVTSIDVTQDSRWPALVDRMQGSEPLACLAVPAGLENDVVGTLTLYGPSSVIRPETIGHAELLAAGLAAVLVELRVRSELETLAGQLEEALTSRATIDQAKGILMAQHACSADQAFTMLSRQSQETNTKLKDLAERLVLEAMSGDRSSRTDDR